LCEERVPPGLAKVVRDHFLDHRVQRDLRCPSKFPFRLLRITEQRLDLGWTEVAWINTHDGGARLDRRSVRAANGSDDSVLLQACSPPLQIDPQFRGRS